MTLPPKKCLGVGCIVMDDHVHMSSIKMVLYIDRFHLCMKYERVIGSTPPNLPSQKYKNAYKWSKIVRFYDFVDNYRLEIIILKKGERNTGRENGIDLMHLYDTHPKMTAKVAT